MKVSKALLCIGLVLICTIPFAFMFAGAVDIGEPIFTDGEQVGILGDVNEDGVLSAADAHDLLLYATNMATIPVDDIVADIDASGVITSVDSRLLSVYISEIACNEGVITGNTVPESDDSPQYTIRVPNAIYQIGDQFTVTISLENADDCYGGVALLQWSSDSIRVVEAPLTSYYEDGRLANCRVYQFPSSSYEFAVKFEVVSEGRIDFVVGTANHDILGVEDPAQATATVIASDSAYEIHYAEDGSIVIDEYRGNEENLIIPADFYGIPVSTIAYSAFTLYCAGDDLLLEYGREKEWLPNLKSITLPSTITNIESHFSSCSNLEKFIVDESNAVFYADSNGVLYSNEEEVALFAYPHGAVMKEYNVPLGTNRLYGITNEYLETITFPATVTNFSTFNCPNLKVINLGDAQVTEESLAKNHSYDLEQYSVSPSNPLYTSVDGVVFSKNMDCLYAYPRGNEQEIYVLPDSVKRIAEFAFAGAPYLREVILPSGVESIDSRAFYSCENLSKIYLPESVTTIGDRLFDLCYELTDIAIANPELVIPEKSLGGFWVEYEITPTQFGSYYHKTDTIFYGIENSTAATYAQENEFEFLPLDSYPVTEIEDLTTEPNVTDSTLPSTELPQTNPSVESSSESSNDVSTEPASGPSTEPSTEPSEPAAEPEPVPTLPPAGDTENPVLTPLENSGIAVNETEKIATIAAGLDSATLRAELSNANVAILQADGSVLAEESLVGTGCKVQVLSESGEVLSEYEILVPMDVSGDGRITSADARTALRSAVSLESLQGVYSQAADANGDTRCTSTDARAILRKSIGLE